MLGRTYAMGAWATAAGLQNGWQNHFPSENQSVKSTIFSQKCTDAKQTKHSRTLASALQQHAPLGDKIWQPSKPSNPRWASYEHLH
jgi:hypothetical protein